MAKIYLGKKVGQSRQDSIYFGDSNQIQAALFPNENPDDIASYCWELHKKEYISCTPGDNIANDITLQPNTIVFMEQRFPRGLKQVLEVLGQISSFCLKPAYHFYPVMAHSICDVRSQTGHVDFGLCLHEVLGHEIARFGSQTYHTFFFKSEVCFCIVHRTHLPLPPRPCGARGLFTGVALPVLQSTQAEVPKWQIIQPL